MRSLKGAWPAVLLCTALAAPAWAQEPVGREQLALTNIKDLYAAAAYEDALAAVNSMQGERIEPAVEQYRAFCLIALGRSAEAQKVIESLIATDPLYMPDTAEMSPRVLEAFAQTRRQLLPDLTRRMYTDAKAALDRKDRLPAIAQFERLLQIIDSAGPAAASFTDLRLLASGFLDLSRALPPPLVDVKPAAPPPPAPASPAPRSVAEARTAMNNSMPTAPPPPAPGTPASTSGLAADNATIPAGIGAPRPTAIKQDLPPWFPSDPQSRQRAFSGSVRVRIGADGRVESANIIRPVHPAYDNELLRAARTWLYQPATQDGVAVPVDLIVEIVLRPRE